MNNEELKKVILDFIEYREKQICFNKSVYVHDDNLHKYVNDWIENIWSKEQL